MAATALDQHLRLEMLSLEIIDWWLAGQLSRSLNELIGHIDMTSHFS